MQHPGGFILTPRGGFGGQTARPFEPLRSPWRRVRRGALLNDGEAEPAAAGEAGRDAHGDRGAEAALPTGLGSAQAGPPLGIERRLVRRAEALWESLRAGAPLPPSQAAAAFHGRLFDEHAIELSLPPHPADPSSHAARIVRIGQAVASLGLATPGSVAPDIAIHAGVAERLAALAERAVALAEPVLLEIDTTACPALPGMPALLLRAVALPFAQGSHAAGPTVVVVASWRHLLPPEEAAAIQEELAAAIDWLRHHG